MMETAGKSHFTALGRLISVAIVLLALAVALYSLHETAVHPTSTDSSIDADVVHVAAAVGGRILEIPVAENSRVSEGDLLFQIDPLPYRLAVAQGEADLLIAQAQLDTRRRVVSTQRSAAVIAGQTTKTAQENHELAARTLDRLRPLQPTALCRSNSSIRLRSTSATPRRR
jgi:multidrug efflux system membrane fusion protein